MRYLGLLVVVVWAGCGKTEQCQQLARATTSIQLELPAGDQSAAFRALAEQAERSARLLETVELKDRKLLDLRHRYLAAVEAYALAARNTASALAELEQSRLADAGRAPRSALEQRARAEHEALRHHAHTTSLVVAELKRYCSGR